MLYYEEIIGKGPICCSQAIETTGKYVNRWWQKKNFVGKVSCAICHHLYPVEIANVI